MIGYDDIKRIAGESNDSGLQPDEELERAGIDPDSVVRVADEMVDHTLWLSRRIGAENGASLLASLFLSGFGLGVLVVNEIAKQPETV